MNNVLLLLLLYGSVISLILASIALVCVISWNFTDDSEEDDDV